MDQATWSTLCQKLQGMEVMVWTRGGHFFRGVMKSWDEHGGVIMEKASCPLANQERGERDWVIIQSENIDAIS